MFGSRCEMDRTIRKLISWYQIPQIEIMPMVGRSLFRKGLMIFVICPARVKEIIADVAVEPIADQHRLINQQRKRRDSHACLEHIEGQRIMQGGQLMKIFI